MNISEIASVRAVLAAWAERKPRGVRRAAANLDRWLEVATEPPEARVGVDVTDCAKRAVEILRKAIEG